MRLTTVLHSKGATQTAQPTYAACARDAAAGNAGGVVLFKAVARYEFPGEAEGDLPLAVDDVVDVMEVVDEAWLRGACNGREGIFPKDYVEQLGGDEAASTAVAAAAPEEPTAAASEEASASADAGASLGFAKALFDFDAEAEDDLGFKAGDMIEVAFVIDAEWLRGRLDGREGLVPRSYVEFSE